MLQSLSLTLRRSDDQVESAESMSSAGSYESPSSSPLSNYAYLESMSSRSSGIWSDPTAKPIVGLRWSLLNCDEHWMRFICPGLQTIRWKSFSWFQVRGIMGEAQLRFVEIYPSAGHQEVLEVNGSVVRDPRRLCAGDIISVMGEYRWEVRNDFAVIDVVHDNDESDFT